MATDSADKFTREGKVIVTAICIGFSRGRNGSPDACGGAPQHHEGAASFPTSQVERLRRLPCSEWDLEGAWGDGFLTDSAG